MLGSVAVYGFFTVSGYLVSQSWDSLRNMPAYFIRRVLRLIPRLLGVSAGDGSRCYTRNVVVEARLTSRLLGGDALAVGLRAA